MFLRLIFAMALFYVAVAENMRGAAKNNLDIADVQQGDILNAMERFTRAFSKGATGLKLPDNFKKADGSFISIPHSVKVINEAEEKRKLGDDPTTPPGPCDGDGASEVKTNQIDDKYELTYNFMSVPAFPDPIPTDAAGFTTLAASIAESVATGAKICTYMKVDIGTQGLNWDESKGAVETETFSLDGDTDVLTAECTNCYARMGGQLTYKADCEINTTSPGSSSCTINLVVGGGVAYNLDMSITNLNFAGDDVPNTLVEGDKTQIFFDPDTTISVSVTPTLSVAFSGTAKSNGKLTWKSSLTADDVALGIATVTSASEPSFTVGSTGDIDLPEPTITSELQMDSYDLTISVTPNLMWTIGAGQMATAPYATFPTSTTAAATGMAVEVDIPNPNTFSWNFKKTADETTSTISAAVGFLFKSMNTYLAANYYYTGCTATMSDYTTLYDYSQWPDSSPPSTSLEYKYGIYEAPTDAKTVTQAMTADVPGTLSLNGDAAPASDAPTPADPTKAPTPADPTKAPSPADPTKAPSPDPNPDPNPPTAAPTKAGGSASTSSDGDAKSGMSGGAVAGLVIGLLFAVAGGYYFYTLHTAKASDGLDTKLISEDMSN